MAACLTVAVTCGIAVPKAGAADLVAGAPDPAQAVPVEPVAAATPAPEVPTPSQVEPSQEATPEPVQEVSPEPVQEVSPEPVNDVVVPVAAAAEETSAQVQEAAIDQVAAQAPRIESAPADLVQPVVADLESVAADATRPVNEGLGNRTDALHTVESEVAALDSTIRRPVRELGSGLAPAPSRPPVPDPVISPASALPFEPLSGFSRPDLNPTSAATPAAAASAPAASVLSSPNAPAPESLEVSPARPAPASPPAPDPGKGPESPSGAAGPSSGGFFLFTFAAMLLGLLVLAGQAVSRRIRSVPVSWRPVHFVSLLERPG